MERLIIVLWWLLLAVTSANAQKYDFTWMMGYSQPTEDEKFGVSVINFGGDTMPVVRRDSSILFSFNSTNTCISDADSGALLFYSNNIALFDRRHDWMQGASPLNETDAFILPQGVIALPHPKGANWFALINGRREFFATDEISVSMTKAWYSEIDMNANDGLGELALKQELLIEDILSVGKITAVRHGNGRDWWVLIRQYCNFCERERYYKILISPKGWERSLQNIIDLSLAPPTPSGLGQAVFTPDGNKYLISSSIEIGEPHYLDVYDFDRCTGRLSNRKQVKLAQIASLTMRDGGSGLAISPNSRFAYVILWWRVVQYDLWADDIEASAITVAEYDGFEDDYLPTSFFMGQLAPDGKIYICTTNSTRYLHVIHNPNEKGLACDLRQHDLKLPTLNSLSIPNYPNYRLYDLPDSPCDTLGINFDGSVTSTEDFIEAESTIAVYPNPAFDVVHIKVEQRKNLEIRLYSMLGELVTVQKDTVLDVHYLASGVYVVAVLSEGELIGTRKIVVQ